MKKAVEDRDAGVPPATRWARMVDDWRDVLEGWVTDSKGKIRGDKAHERLRSLGYTGTDRTTRRALAEIKSQWRLGNTRVHRPWITEPGLWLQYDFADGPIVAGRKVVLVVAWLAWCRYRVVIPLRDRTAPSVFAGLDRFFRILGGAPLAHPAGLQTLEWVQRRENLVVCGPAGTGKTFFLEALGQKVIEAGMPVAWFTLEQSGVLVRAHRADDSLGKAVAKIVRAELVVVDDVGLLPVGADAAEGLYRIVEAAYEGKSVAISSNLHPSGFDELMPKTLATATVDRLLHHAHLCQTSGDSVRLAQALHGKGVKPLT